MPGSALTPLAGVPYSGVPRQKHVGDLNDDDLAQLADSLACLNLNGYGRDCYLPSDGAKYITNDPACIGGWTCHPTEVEDPATPPYDYSRESVMYVYRNQFSACPVAVLEDCGRERVSIPVGAQSLVFWTPDCTALDQCFNLKGAGFAWKQRWPTEGELVGGSRRARWGSVRGRR